MKNRILYDEKHWARIDNPQIALNEYLNQYNHPFSRAKASIYRRYIGKDLQGKKVLDYGGGAGYMSVYCAMHGAQVVLVDIEQNALKTAKYFAEIKGVAGSLQLLLSDVFPQEIRDMKFDLIILKDIIEHIQDDNEFLKDLSKCQEIGGKLLLSTQNLLSINSLLGILYWRFIKDNRNWCGWDNTHVRFYTISKIRQMLARFNYKVERVSTIYTIPYGANNHNKRWAIPVVCLSTYFDMLLGEIFPFNRMGFDFVVDALKIST